MTPEQFNTLINQLTILIIIIPISAALISSTIIILTYNNRKKLEKIERNTLYINKTLSLIDTRLKELIELRKNRTQNKFK